MRAMQRFLLCVALLGLACSTRPSEEDCRAAIAKINELNGLGNRPESEIEMAVRDCRGGWSKDSVQCVRNAKDPAAVDECMKK
jgi:hypothetical protein